MQEALKIIQERSRPAAPPSHLLDRDPWEQTPFRPPEERGAQFAPPPLTHNQATLSPSARTGAPQRVAAVDPRARVAATPAPTPAARTEPASQALSSDPTRLFDVLTTGGHVLGALLLDTQGLVLAGSLAGERADRAEELGAILGGTLEEVLRTVANLELGTWRGILLESERALVQLIPVREDTVVLIAAKRETPTGWMARSAGQAAALARRFLETYG